MILYKYYPCNEYTFKSLAMKGLWCHTYEHMNDPFECLVVIDRLFSEESLEKFRQVISRSSESRLKQILKLNNENLTILINRFRKAAIRKYAFCSFSEDPNSILMWSHYAKAHSGIVIGFEFPELENNHHLQKVRYQDKLEDIDLEDYAKYYIGEADHYINEVVKDYSVKSLHWDYEKEWRIWTAEPCYYHYQPSQVKEVHLGLNITQETEIVVLELMNYLPEAFLINKKELTINPLGIK